MRLWYISMGDNTLFSEDCETVLHSGIKKTVNADVSLASFTSLIWSSLSHSFSSWLQEWKALPLCLTVIFSFLCIFSSHSPLIYQARLQYISFSIFISLSFHSASQLVSIPFLLFRRRDCSAPSSLNFHLFTLSFSLTQSCSLWCAPRPAFVLNPCKFMRHASSCCNSGWKC